MKRIAVAPGKFKRVLIVLIVIVAIAGTAAAQLTETREINGWRYTTWRDVITDHITAYVETTSPQWWHLNFRTDGEARLRIYLTGGNSSLNQVLVVQPERFGRAFQLSIQTRFGRTEPTALVWEVSNTGEANSGMGLLIPPATVNLPRLLMHDTLALRVADPVHVWTVYFDLTGLREVLQEFAPDLLEPR